MQIFSKKEISVKSDINVKLLSANVWVNILYNISKKTATKGVARHTIIYKIFFEDQLTNWTWTLLKKVKIHTEKLFMDECIDLTSKINVHWYLKNCRLSILQKNYATKAFFLFLKTENRVKLFLHTNRRFHYAR